MISKEFLLNASKKEHNDVLKNLYKKIPQEFLQPNKLKSYFYLFFDFFMIFCLFFIGYYAYQTHNYILAFFYILLQGSFFWSLFVIGHDCGHESFSSSSKENRIIGYLTHSFILVPFYSWKLSHHKHHSFHNNIDKDESHIAIPIDVLKLYLKNFKNKKLTTQVYVLFFLMFSSVGLAFPLYLFNNNFFKNDELNHFNYKSKLFEGHESFIKNSIYFVLTMFFIILSVAFLTSFKLVLVLYIFPWLIFNFLLYYVTYLQHMNNETSWFYNDDWTYLKGAFQTVDYDYGKFLGPIINFLHHNIERYHVIHHLNFKIPHYNLKKTHEFLLNDFKDVYLLKNHPILSYLKIKYVKNYLFTENKNDQVKEYKLMSLKETKKRLKDLR